MSNYNTLAEIQYAEDGQRDNRGSPTTNWTKRGQAWGTLTKISARDVIAFNQRLPTVSSKFETHYQPGLYVTGSGKWRLVLADKRELYIVSVDNVREQNKTWVWLVSEEVTA